MTTEIRQSFQNAELWSMRSGRPNVFSWHIECDRDFDEEIDLVGRRLSESLGVALKKSPEALDLWLVANSEMGVRRAHRVQALKSIRAGFWRRFQGVGFGLPVGREVQIDLSDAELIKFSGFINFELAELPKALELTRHGNALCLMFDRRVDEFAKRSILEKMARSDAIDFRLLEVGLRAAGDGILVSRLHGYFDDETITVQVFGSEENVRRITGCSED